MPVAETDPTTDSHTGHLGAGVPGIYRLTITCTKCHPDHTGANAHRNGSVNVQVHVNGSVTVVANPLAAGGCGTNDCHRQDLATPTSQAPLRNTYSWGTALTDDCASCHQGTNMASRSHSAHLGSNALPGTNLTYNITDECVACHNQTTVGTGKATTVQHLDGGLDVTFNAAYDYEGTTVVAGKHPCPNCFNFVRNPVLKSNHILSYLTHGIGRGRSKGAGFRDGDFIL